MHLSLQTSDKKHLIKSVTKKLREYIEILLFYMKGKELKRGCENKIK